MPRWARVLILVVAALAVLVLAVVVLLVVDYGTCSGDGGSPFSANDSTAGRFCNGPLRLPWGVAFLVVPLGLVVVLGVVGVVRSSTGLLAGAVGAGVAAIVVLALTVVALPGSCSGSDQRAYDRWIEGGRAEPRPADCETY
jgi:hypothetical protein